ncbi:hypothetical protein BT96DRAFT_308442 [Gymnopus androsaceus JB14]|uniref:Uncharacterized protein n=1 Tax=Gymnopus androsaceus JB14 TaxID=1447944 RepID=A0A6A4GI54_9AGAR|nr:hypothetical protein BT96DRAFT_1026656 [Gymnopus androsaceus JB14]KAE9391497.1 hypothetical protein BT96DRAFT_308442 [Gymnopus androsaceus JB14]
MVKWAFTNLPELKTSLEFHQTPTIFFSNQFPYEGIPLGVSLGFQLFGGTQCTLYKPCNGLIQLNPDPQKTPYVLISTGVTGAPIFKTGTSLPEARVSFIKPVQGGPEVVPMADTIARNLVKWLLEQQKVVTALGFSQSPKVIYLDQFLFKVIEKKSAVHFQFHGGKKCTPVLPCYGLVGIDHTKEPHPLRYGSVYDYNYLSGHSERKPIVLVGEEP